MLGKASNFARRARELGEAAQRPETFQLKSGMVTAEQARGLFMGSVAQGGYVAGIFGTGIGIATGRDDVGSFAMGSVGAGATLGALAGGVVGMRRGKAGKIVTDAQSYWRATISGKPELMPKSSFMDALVKDGKSQAAAGKAHLDGLKVKDYTDADIRRYVNKQWKNAPDSPIPEYAGKAFNKIKNYSTTAFGNAKRQTGDAFDKVKSKIRDWRTNTGNTSQHNYGNNQQSAASHAAHQNGPINTGQQGNPKKSNPGGGNTGGSNTKGSNNANGI